MKVVSAAVVALVLVAASSAHAAIVTDVDNLVLPPAGTTFYGGDLALLAAPGNPVLLGFPNDSAVFQTWTPTVQGQLETLDLLGTTGIHFGGAPIPDFNFTLTIYSGDVRQGGAVELGSLDFASAAFSHFIDVHSFDLGSLSISTTPGQIMTFGFSIDACDPTQVCVFAAPTKFFSGSSGGPLTLLAASDGYAGGGEFSRRNGAFVPASNLPAQTDLSFRISVDDSPIAPVPEPGVWALMLSGMFGAGAMLRRRRLVALPLSS